MTQTQLKTLKQQYSKKQLFDMYFPQCLNDVCRLLDIVPFEKQKIILYGKYKIKIIRSARRTAKSFTSALEAYSLLYFGFLFDYPMRLVSCGPRTYDVRHIWRYLNQFWEKAPLSQVFSNCEIIYSNSGSKTQDDKSWIFKNSTEVVSASGNDIEMNDIRGDANDWIFVDEFGQFRYKEQLLDALMYTLKDDEPLGLARIVGTHDVIGNGKEFDRLFKLGQGDHKHIKSYTLKGSDNPYSNQSSADVARDIVSTEGYLREEMGEAVPAHGRMFGDYFDPKAQIVPIEYDGGDYHRGLDFGFRKPYWFDWMWREVNGQWSVCVFHEYQGKDIRIDGLIEEIDLRQDVMMKGVMPSIFGCDPAGNKVNDVIDYSAFDKLKESYPMVGYTHKPHLVSKANQVALYKKLFLSRRFYVDPSCEMLIRAIMMATPDSNRMGALNSAGWKKEKGIDDPLDAGAYSLIRFAPTSEFIKPIRETEMLSPSMADKLVEKLGEMRI